jgi:PAS domain S-box-containing protein
MMHHETTSFWASAAPCFFGGIALALVTLACFQLELGLATTAFAYLIVIVLFSLMGSFSLSAVLSTMAVAGLSYFFAPPIFSFRIDYPQDSVLVIAFLLTSLIVTGLVGSARKLTQAALGAEGRAEQAKRELRLALETIPAMVGSARPDGFLEFFNHRWLEYLGRPLEDVRGWGWTDAIHPEDLERYLHQRRVIWATGEPFEIEVRLRRADGKYRWFLHRVAALRDEHGSIVKCYEATSDIEDRKRAEEVLREQARVLDLARVTPLREMTASIVPEVNRPAGAYSQTCRD